MAAREQISDDAVSTIAPGGDAPASAIKTLARWIVYPLLVGGSLLLLWAMLHLGGSLAWAPYAVIAIAGPLVILAERALPYRTEWHASWHDLVDDGLYLTTVQILLPLALAWTVVWAVSTYAAGEVVLINIWPSHLPIWAQLILKIMIGDFLRYWLHRAAHTWTPLWRLHAVHHQPEKLYTTNVFRFHPAEKALQFMLDTLPFLLVGIGTEVLAYYFVFYSMSGLFQHSNCDVRLGWFNYLISGPEVHRWHHSVTLSESNANYAHSFVIWDLLFGTYFRPRDRQVDSLGLVERNYPRRFLGQLMAPFRSRPVASDDPT